MQISIYILFFFLCCFACSKNAVEVKSDTLFGEAKIESRISEESDTNSAPGFDKSEWLEKDDHHYPYRNELLEQLLSNHTLDSLKKVEIIDLLGDPNRIDNNYLFYTIAQKRLGFWPLHTKTLVINLTGDETVEWVRVHE